MGKINAKKVIIDGHEFDSTTEGEYYLHLKEQPNIKKITPQPQYTLLAPFKITCSECGGYGKVSSPKTGRPIKCKKCDGTGKRDRRAWQYTADFFIQYKDGTSEVVDVKGGWVNENFRLVKKMFEYTTGQELIVVQKDKKKGWIRK